MKDIFIIGGGDSIREHIYSGLWDLLKGREILAINTAIYTMPYLPSKMIFIDTPVYTSHKAKIEDFLSKGVQCIGKKHSIYDNTGITQYKTCRESHQITDMSNNGLYVSVIGLSGYFALSYAIFHKYDRIFLFGYDFGTINNSKRTHYYQDMKCECKSNKIGQTDMYFNRNNEPKKEVKLFDLYLQFNVPIYNVSINSNIKSFPRINYQQLVELLK